MTENDKIEMNNLGSQLLHEIVAVERHKKRLIEMAVSLFETKVGKQLAERCVRETLNELSK